MTLQIKRGFEFFWLEICFKIEVYWSLTGHWFTFWPQKKKKKTFLPSVRNLHKDRIYVNVSIRKGKLIKNAYNVNIRDTNDAGRVTGHSLCTNGFQDDYKF